MRVEKDLYKINLIIIIPSDKSFFFLYNQLSTDNNKIVQKWTVKSDIKLRLSSLSFSAYNHLVS